MSNKVNSIYTVNLAIRYWLNINSQTKISQNIINYIKSNIINFLLLLVSAAGIFIGIFKFLCYSHELGICISYGINCSLIDLNTNNFYNIFIYLIFFILLVLTNYLFLWINLTGYSQTKRVINNSLTAVIVIFELCLLYVILNNLLLLNYKLDNSCLIISVCLIFIFNFIGFIISYSYKNAIKNNKLNISNFFNSNSSLDVKLSTIIKNFITFGSLIIIFSCFICFYTGYTQKIINNDIRVVNNTSLFSPNIYKDVTDFKITYSTYSVVIYENKDSYVLSPIVINSNNDTYPDINFKKIVSKKEVETYHINNINSIPNYIDLTNNN